MADHLREKGPANEADMDGNPHVPSFAFDLPRQHPSPPLPLTPFPSTPTSMIKLSLRHSHTLPTHLPTTAQNKKNI
ncbi:hypothetical protein E2C01_048070 [Portunus trituberculatus]|uniref:Uncharacterized protein n=1 Tax=Portunus trituberculatus TaxID=210409 RepID=A0A5B7G5D8_PORTR|nr:hypothetical protein [Portunus trituberculatus]